MPKIEISDELNCFSNAGGNENEVLVLRTEFSVPPALYRMPIRMPERLENLCRMKAAQTGLFDFREEARILELNVKWEDHKQKEHQLLIEQHQLLHEEHEKKADELNRKRKRLIEQDPLSKFPISIRRKD